MFCNKCGTEIPAGESKCPNCGESAMSQNNVAQQPQPQPYYPPYYPPAPAQQIVVNAGTSKPSNGCATAGFVLALIGLVLGFTFIFSVLGLILSIVGLAKAKSVDGAGKGLAIAGMIISIISFIPGILLIMLFAGIIGAAAGTTMSSAAPLLLLAL